MHKEYILLNAFRKAKKGFTARFHVPLNHARVFGGQFQNNSRKHIVCLLIAMSRQIRKCTSV